MNKKEKLAYVALGALTYHYLVPATKYIIFSLSIIGAYLLGTYQPEIKEALLELLK